MTKSTSSIIPLNAQPPPQVGVLICLFFSCWFMTVYQITAQTFSLSFWMAQLWLVSTNYRNKVNQMAKWCSDRSFSLKVKGKKVIVGDFRDHTPIALCWLSTMLLWRRWPVPSLCVHIYGWLLLDKEVSITWQERITVSCKLQTKVRP